MADFLVDFLTYFIADFLVVDFFDKIRKAMSIYMITKEKYFYCTIFGENRRKTTMECFTNNSLGELILFYLVFF